MKKIISIVTVFAVIITHSQAAQPVFVTPDNSVCQFAPRTKNGKHKVHPKLWATRQWK